MRATSQRASVARKVVLTGAIGVVSGTAAAASITGSEWSNRKHIIQTEGLFSRIVYVFQTTTPWQTTSQLKRGQSTGMTTNSMR